jgi:hypothetical protein
MLRSHFIGEISCQLTEEEEQVIDEFLAAMKEGRGSSFDLQKLAEALSDSTPQYDPQHGDDIECAASDCGHSYYRHFDPYEKMDPVGCKYCRCSQFVEPPVASPKTTP